MEPLSKASLNNQIVSMRHIVRKSKVHTINKLSREAKKLKEKKGSEEQIVKNKKKAERFVSELMVIKKLNDDVVTKYALQNEVPSATILNSIDISLETRALARLTGHKFITDAIQSFRSKYSDWKFSLTELLNDLGTKYRAKKKPNEKKMVKVKRKTKLLEKNDKTMSDFEECEHTQTEFDAIESEGYETNSNKSNVTEEETQTEIAQFEKMLPVENNFSSEEDQDNKLKPVTTSQAIIVKEKNKSLSRCNKNQKSSQVNVLKTQIPKLVNTQLPELYSNSSTTKSVDDTGIDDKPLKRKAEELVPSKVNYKKKRNMADEIKPICETVDSFFMTADNKDYMSVYKPPPAAEIDLLERPKLEYKKLTNDIFIRGKKVTLGKKHNVGNRRERRQQQVEEPADTVLHPSWEAKRKQKSLAKFEGKKITFDDQD